MKKTILLIIAFGLISALKTEGQKKYFVGADFNGLLPVGSLSNRFNSSAGGSVYFGQQKSNNMAWSGKIEIFGFNDLNTDKLYKKINTVFNGVTKTYKVPLNKMKMNLNVFGISAEGKYKFIEFDKLSSNINFGFGIFNWKFSRNAYKDSVFIDTSGAGVLVNIENLDVPKLLQTDWSGGVSVGVDIAYYFTEPLALVVSGNYKLIIAEIWPTLKLGLENVSGLQMFDLRAGLRFRF